MGKSSIMIDLEDPRTAKIAGVISNKTSKKILGLLAEDELSESEISKRLKMPLNTIGYNIKNLVEAELIEKGKSLWSVKGKRVHRYKLSDKRIVISPKNMIRGVIPAVLISGVIALGIKIFFGTGKSVGNKMRDVVFADKAAEVVSGGGIANGEEIARIVEPPVSEAVGNAGMVIGSQVWLWFLIGALAGLFIFLTWNLIRERVERRVK